MKRTSAWRNRALWLTVLLTLLLAALPAAAAERSGSVAPESAAEETADESTEAAADEVPLAERMQTVIEERVTVVGAYSDVARIPGSAHVLTELELKKHAYSDIHRILRQIPGVNIQEEDGFGLRPNIGIRGTGVERSQKVTLLEDGVLIAPAPYAAPAAYYTPTSGRMESVEVLKGSAAIRQGPYTNGGAINLISRAIPGDRGGTLDVFAGDHGTAKLDATYGGSYERFGYLLETFQQRSHGFKELDGGGSTGFELSDYLLKLRFNTRGANGPYQELEVKIGRTDQDGDETYLGLTADDFAQTPYRRYAGSREDRISTEHDQVQLRYFVYLGDRFDWTTTVYRNGYFRNWYKNESVMGVSNATVLADPLAYATQLGVLRGDLDSSGGALKLRNNRRDYFSQGIQSVLAFEAETGAALHNLEFGVRVHEDEEDRFQEDDEYDMLGGSLELTRLGTPGSQANRIGRAEALAFFLEDRIEIGRFSVTPGLRYESIDLERLDFGQADPERTGDALKTRSNEVDVLIPGLGLSFELCQDWHVFGGVHRGFSPPGPSSTEDVEPEESVSYELGTRYRRGTTTAELVGFLNDYSNLLGADTLSTGGTGSGSFFNGGEVGVYGLEAAFATELYRSGNLAVAVRSTYTYTRGEFRSSFLTSFADWAPEVESGDELPYIPEHQLFVEAGLETDDWSVFLNANLVSEMRTRSGKGAIPEDERIEGHVVFDLSTRYTVASRYKVHLQVRNLTDDAYVASRRPYGLRPGLPRTALVGLSFAF